MAEIKHPSHHARCSARHDKSSGTAVLLVLLLVTLSTSIEAATWSVKPGESITKALRNATSGDTIRVQAGHYAERLLIDKAIVLSGNGRPTLSGSQLGDVIRVRAPDVVIEGIIIRDSGADLTAQNAGIYVEPGADRIAIRGNDLTYNLFGIWLQGVKDVEVSGNLIIGKRDLPSAQRGNGIQLYNTSGARIIGNQISFARDGIYVDVSHHAVFRNNRIHHLRYGTHYMNSHFNIWEDNEAYLNRGGLALMEVRNQVVRNNRAWGNSDHGIMLRTIQNSVIENNVVARNGRGLFIYDAEYNSFSGNLIIDNRIGIHVAAGSIHNQVNANDFIQNHDQVKYVASKDEHWGIQRGNYWSDYLGWDRDGNGVGDVAYATNDLVDRLYWQYPMMAVMLNSPAVQTLRLVARQFPLLRAPSIVDQQPPMRPYSPTWSHWLDGHGY